jgi:hypothetical protein
MWSNRCSTLHVRLEQSGHRGPLAGPLQPFQRQVSALAERQIVADHRPTPERGDSLGRGSHANGITRPHNGLPDFAKAAARCVDRSAIARRNGFTSSMDAKSGTTDLVGPAPPIMLLARPIATYHRREDISGNSRILLDSPGTVAIPVMAVWHIDAHVESLRKQSVTERFTDPQQHLELES